MIVGSVGSICIVVSAVIVESIINSESEYMRNEFSEWVSVVVTVDSKECRGSS